ncbi:hypothetical protein HYV44_00965 [Candidatus Microgenomates bacterium]|nr:hypothetical protein [Candidatus Microgenomates bacterium]
MLVPFFLGRQKSAPQAPIIADFKKKFGFQAFCSDFSQGFGFDGAFVPVKRQPKDFIVLSALIPRVKKRTEEKCRFCGGSKKHPYHEGRCPCCEGGGYDFWCDYQEAFAISASLCFFGFWAFHPKENTSSKEPQIMTIDFATLKDMHGGSISGDFSLSLGRYLSSFPAQTSRPEMVEAMIRAHRRMYGPLSKFEKYNFRASIDYDTGWLNVSCPGDACGINPMNGHVTKNEGYQFGGHNMDNPAQQLTILAGLAALSDRFRRDLNFENFSSENPEWALEEALIIFQKNLGK